MDAPLRIVIVGPGRAGMSLGLAATRAGHDVVGVLGRSYVDERAEQLGSRALDWEHVLPECDLIVVAVRDDAIAGAAKRLARVATDAQAAVHLSGLTSVSALEPLAAAGLQTGGFHPLQTMPNPEDGSAALSGAWIGITAGEPLHAHLETLARSIGAHPFDLVDEMRPLYHAAAAAAANYVLTALWMSADLFAAAGVPFAAARPLVQEVIANAFDLGPGSSMTGPIARGDVGTVAGQIAAIEAIDGDLAERFKAIGRVTAWLVEAGEEMREVLE